MNVIKNEYEKQDIEYVYEKLKTAYFVRNEDHR
jgi:hypothetical protein